MLFKTYLSSWDCLICLSLLARSRQKANVDRIRIFTTMEICITESFLMGKKLRERFENCFYLFNNEKKK